MKKILVLSVLFFGISVYLMGCPRPGTKCDKLIILIADPSCCSRYFTCDGGQTVAEECPNGLYFSQRHQICTWWWEPGAVFDCMAPGEEGCPPLLKMPEITTPCDDWGDGGDIEDAIKLICSTETVGTHTDWWTCQECGEHYPNKYWETRMCNKGIFSFCYPGYTITYYRCKCHGGGTDGVKDFTEISTCF